MPNSHCFAITNIAWLFIADKFTSSKSSSWVVHYFSSLIQLVHLASKTLSWFSSYFTIPPPQSLSLISPLLLDFLMLEWPSTVLFPLPFPTYTFSVSALSSFGNLIQADGLKDHLHSNSQIYISISDFFPKFQTFISNLLFYNST